MGSPKWLLFLQFSILTHLLGLTLTTAKDPWLSYGTCGDRGYYTENSPYRSNLEFVLSSLPKTHNGYGFFTLSAGKGDESDSANTIAMCRGDVTANRCVSCVTNATNKLRQYCPNQKEATGWFDSCLLSYSNATLLDTIDRSHTAFKQGKNGTVANWAQFSRSLKDLFRRLREEAAKGGSFRKYAAGNSTGPGSVGTIYGTMQCNPELSQIQCDKCLLEATMDLIALNSGKIGGRSFYRYSCTIRYETYRFFNATWYPPPPPSRKHLRPAPNSGKKGWIWSIIGVESFAILLLFYTAKAKKIRKMLLREGQGTNGSDPSVKYCNSSRNDTKETRMNHELRLFSFESMSVATNNFSTTNKLGEGGFGSVYKGKLLDGQEVAVKRLSRSSNQGVKEFENEIRLIAKLQHTNLVRLLGCCIENEEKVLAYEYMPNNSLDFFLFDPAKKELLRWEKRFAIIEGIAQGLLYLHKYSRLRVIHRDLKASNILLDDRLNPKISDFGMAKIFGIDESESNTTRVVGTRGYMSPEYLIEGIVSMKTDVFSFGVLLLEIVSSKMNIGSHDVEHPLNLAGLAWELWKEGRALELMDPVLGDTCCLNEVMRCIHIGLLCVQDHASDRPSMTNVVSMLTNENVLLPNPKRPAFFIERHEIDLAKKNKSGNGSMSSLSISNPETK